MKLSDYSMTMLLKPSILSYLDVVTIEILVVVAVDTLDDVDDDVEIELDVDKLRRKRKIVWHHYIWGLESYRLSFFTKATSPPPLTLDLNKSTWYKISSHKNNFIRFRCDFN